MNSPALQMIVFLTPVIFLIKELLKGINQPNCEPVGTAPHLLLKSALIKLPVTN